MFIEIGAIGTALLTDTGFLGNSMNAPTSQLFYRWWRQLLIFLIAFNVSPINKSVEKYRGSFTITHKRSFTICSVLLSHV